MKRFSLRWAIVLVVLPLALLFGVALSSGAGTPGSVFMPVMAKNVQNTELLRGYVQHCATIHWQVVIYAWVMGADGAPLSQSDLPNGPHQVVYSEAPEGTVLGSSGLWSGSLTVSNQPVEKDWYVWVVNGANQRASEIVTVHSDSELGLGNCQSIGVTFFSSSIVAATPNPLPTSTLAFPQPTEILPTPTRTPTRQPTEIFPTPTDTATPLPPTPTDSPTP